MIRLMVDLADIQPEVLVVESVHPFRVWCLPNSMILQILLQGNRRGLQVLMQPRGKSSAVEATEGQDR
jgi:hypothetical protein